MATVKRTLDLEQYVNVLPYASEMFGIYQPLLGWKSKRITERFEQGLNRDKTQILRSLAREMCSRMRSTRRSTSPPISRSRARSAGAVSTIPHAIITTSPATGKAAIPVVFTPLANSDKLGAGGVVSIFYTHHFALTGGQEMTLADPADFYKKPVSYRTFFQQAVEEIG